MDAITAPPPAPVPVTGHDEAPVLVGGEPQVSSGGTAAPEEESGEADTASGPAPVAGSEPATDPKPAGTESPAAVASPVAPESTQPGTNTPPLPER
jgi:hypothetical protein